jgi:hypothetical protein
MDHIHREGETGARVCHEQEIYAVRRRPVLVSAVAVNSAAAPSGIVRPRTHTLTRTPPHPVEVRADAATDQGRRWRHALRYERLRPDSNPARSVR